MARPTSFANRELSSGFAATSCPTWRATAAADRPLRIWSAGGTTGEEPYSLAILLEEAGLAHRAYILATDIAPQALERARRGIYRPGPCVGRPPSVPGSICSRGTRATGTKSQLRRRVHFAAVNLARDSYAAAGTFSMDLILCRNVLIYFDPDTIARVAQYLALADGAIC